MLSNLILSLAISFAVGLNGITKNENNNFNNNNNVNNVNNTINNKVDTSESSSEVSYPIYDDVNKQISLNAYQLNNYTFNNLSEINSLSTDIPSIGYDGEEYTNDDTDNGDLEGYGLIYLCTIDEEDYGIGFNYHEQSKFTYINQNSDEILPFEFFITLECNTSNDSYYQSIKTAIQADIQANEQTGTMGDNIIDAITSGLGLIGDLAREFLTGFSTLFWDATANNNAGALTPFGQFALVMLGVAITMAIISLVLALIKGNTGA